MIQPQLFYFIKAKGLGRIFLQLLLMKLEVLVHNYLI